jgi:ATP-dependent protease Clp ATPase subunit
VSDKPPVYCSFCNKSEHQVQVIVAGAKASICDECVDECATICGERRAARRQAVRLADIRVNGT